MHSQTKHGDRTDTRRRLSVPHLHFASAQPHAISTRSCKNDESKEDEENSTGKKEKTKVSDEREEGLSKWCVTTELIPKRRDPARGVWYPMQRCWAVCIPEAWSIWLAYANISDIAPPLMRAHPARYPPPAPRPMPHASNPSARALDKTVRRDRGRIEVHDFSLLLVLISLSTSQ